MPDAGLDYAQYNNHYDTGNKETSFASRLIPDLLPKHWSSFSWTVPSLSKAEALHVLQMATAFSSGIMYSLSADQIIARVTM